MALTQIEKAEKFDKIQAKKKEEKAQSHVLLLRGIEGGSLAVSSLILGGINDAKPEWDSAFYGLLSPNVIAAIAGLGAFVFAGKSDVMRETGAGMAMAGAAPLLQRGGAKLHQLIFKA